MCPLARFLTKKSDNLERYLIVGLGNPGKKYIDTRHNIGFDMVQSIASYYNIKVKKNPMQGYNWRGENRRQQCCFSNAADLYEPVR